VVCVWKDESEKPIFVNSIIFLTSFPLINSVGIARFYGIRTEYTSSVKQFGRNFL